MNYNEYLFTNDINIVIQVIVALQLMSNQEIFKRIYKQDWL